MLISHSKTLYNQYPTRVRLKSQTQFLTCLVHQTLHVKLWPLRKLPKMIMSLNLSKQCNQSNLCIPLQAVYVKRAFFATRVSIRPRIARQKTLRTTHSSIKALTNQKDFKSKAKPYLLFSLKKLQKSLSPIKLNRLCSLTAKTRNHKSIETLKLVDQVTLAVSN